MEKIVFNNLMQQCRTAHLTALPGVKKVALVGEGDGDFLIELLKRCDCEQVHYIDSSQAMLKLARNRLQEHSEEAVKRVEFFHRDLISESMPDQDYDLIVTNFFLDVFNEESLVDSISKITASCKRGTFWLYADFQISGGKFQQLRAIIWLNLMYLFFKIVAQIQAHKLVDPSMILEQQGFQLKAVSEFGRGLMRSELRQRD
ncbi:MAG: class I SAM-dependent methyltransferase [Planctomycetes bacterium]|nr:class I SAM-dependent methyltransferase [Planctomycetota bacterium]